MKVIIDHSPTAKVTTRAIDGKIAIDTSSALTEYVHITVFATDARGAKVKKRLDIRADGKVTTIESL